MSTSDCCKTVGVFFAAFIFALWLGWLPDKLLLSCGVHDLDWKQRLLLLVCDVV